MRVVSYFKSLDVYKLRKLNKPISYTTARENVSDAVKHIKLYPKNFGLHSLRSGGAIAAANYGVRNYLRDMVKDGYETTD